MFAITFAIVVLSPKEGHRGYHGLSAAGRGGGARVLGDARWHRCFGVHRRLSVGSTCSAWRRPCCSCMRCCARNSGWPAARDHAARAEGGSDEGPARGRLPAQLQRGDRRRRHLHGHLYACRCAQYMVVGQVDLATAFLVAVAPFVVVDFCKIVAAVICADKSRAACGRRYRCRFKSSSKCQLGRMVSRVAITGLTGICLPFTP